MAENTHLLIPVYDLESSLIKHISPATGSKTAPTQPTCPLTPLLYGYWGGGKIVIVAAHVINDDNYKQNLFCKSGQQTRHILCDRFAYVTYFF